MRPIAEVLVSQRAPTPDENSAIDLVHDLCRNWQSGMPLTQVRQHSTGKERWTATRFTPPPHTMFTPLHAMLKVLVDTDMTDRNGKQYQTRYGTFNAIELRHVNARITETAEGLTKILFPILYPWRRRPDPEGNDEGEAGEPVYAHGHDERMEMARREYRSNRTSQATSTRRHVFD
ncbi:MAG TPA: hypothetical protein VNJ04_19630 [Gemmatimonadaceae bacterium]|nr:hypothetical protein [Gemmatimonadaceae bacterium]